MVVGRVYRRLETDGLTGCVEEGSVRRPYILVHLAKSLQYVNSMFHDEGVYRHLSCKGCDYLTDDGNIDCGNTCEDCPYLVKEPRGTRDPGHG